MKTRASPQASDQESLITDHSNPQNDTETGSVGDAQIGDSPTTAGDTMDIDSTARGADA